MVADVRSLTLYSPGTLYMRESPICPTSSFITHTSGLRDFHINRLRALKQCAFWQTDFQSKTPRYKSTSGQHFLQKYTIALSQGLLSRGAGSANEHASIMYKLVVAFLVCPDALGSPQLRIISGTSVNIMS